MFPWTTIAKIALCVEFCPSKHTLIENTELCFPIGLSHTWRALGTRNQPVYSKQRYTHLRKYSPRQSSAVIMSVCHCKSLGNHFDTSVLQLVDMRQLEFRYALPQVRGKFMAKYVLISFLAEILELLLACTCLY